MVWNQYVEKTPAPSDRIVTPSQGNLTKVERYKWTIKDEPGTFQKIDKRMLCVDPSYQRDLHKGKALAIAKMWSWVACGVIIVAYRDGEFRVMDGQHRVSAAMSRADIDELPCMVFNVDDVVNEAQGFLDSNTARKAPTCVDRFRAQVITEEAVAVVVNEMVEQSGRSIGKSASPTTICCVGALRAAVEADEAYIRRLWPLIVKISKGYPLPDRIVTGLFYVETHLPAYKTLTDKYWSDRVIRTGLTNLLDAAYRATLLQKRGGAKIWAFGMVEAINKGCRIKLKLDLKDEVEP